MPKKSKGEIPVVGHNSVAGDQLKSYIERAEKLQDEKVALQSDIRDLFAEMKGNGFDIKAVKNLIKLRAADRAKLEEEAEILKVYAHAIGEDFSFL